MLIDNCSYVVFGAFLAKKLILCINGVINSINAAINRVIAVINKQSKVKESKVKKSKRNKKRV